jgi:cell division protein YceG involved in septum cleavage
MASTPDRSHGRVLLIAVVLVLAVAGAVAAGLWWLVERPLPMRDERVEIVVAQGASTRAIGESLRAAGVDLQVDLFVRGSATRPGGCVPGDTRSRAACGSPTSSTGCAAVRR